MVAELRQSEGFFARNPEFNPLRHYTDFVRELFEEAKKIGRIRPELDIDALALMVIGSMDMLICQWLIDPEGVDTQQVIQNVRAIFAYGVRTTRPDGSAI